MENLLDKHTIKLLEQSLEKQVKTPAKYFIGVDSCDNKVFSYCLMRCQGENWEVILANTRKKEAEFIEEVANIKKYFNAVETKAKKD